MGPIRPMGPMRPMNAHDKPGFIPPHGNYQELLSYQKAEVVYDLTYRFCQRFLSRGDRTIDQMIQATRSGKQNIVEGSKASGTSKETEIKLIGVARASLDEVLNDYCDLLRVRDLPIWEKESREARFVRQIGIETSAKCFVGLGQFNCAFPDGLLPFDS